MRKLIVLVIVLIFGCAKEKQEQLTNSTVSRLVSMGNLYMVKNSNCGYYYPSFQVISCDSVVIQGWGGRCSFNGNEMTIISSNDLMSPTYTKTVYSVNFGVDSTLITPSQAGYSAGGKTIPPKPAVYSAKFDGVLLKLIPSACPSDSGAEYKNN